MENDSSKSAVLWLLFSLFVAAVVIAERSFQWRSFNWFLLLDFFCFRRQDFFGDHMRFPIYFLIFARSKLCCSAKSFLDSKSAPQLVYLVTDLFSWILRRQKNPILWKSSIITVFHGSGSKTLVPKTDQSAYFFYWSSNVLFLKIFSQ